MTYKRPDFSAEPYTNEFGQVINPGDKVMCIATRRQRTRQFLGTYEGVNRSVSYWNRDLGPQISSVRVSGIPTKRYVRNPQTRNYESVDMLRTTTLPLQRIFKLA